jgi:rubrerythrin
MPNARNEGQAESHHAKSDDDGSHKPDEGRDQDFSFCPVCGYVIVACARTAICPQCGIRVCPSCGE